MQLTDTGPTSQHRSTQDLAEIAKLGDDLSQRIEVQHRAWASPQAVKGAAVYLLNLPSLSAGVGGESLRTQVVAELQTHAEILRANPSAMLILLLDLLSDVAGVDRDVQVTAYLRDLSLWQMTNGWGMCLAELMELVNGVQDAAGELTVSNTLLSRNGITTALQIKYKCK